MIRLSLFPAADEEQFNFTKQVIDQSDYYIVISAGRYGSVHPTTKLSYTEMEYDYAVEQGKTVIRLLHRDPFSLLQGEFIDQSDEKRAKLERFRNKISHSSMVNFWSDHKELGQQVVFGLMDARKRAPAVGWVRGDKAISVEMLEELDQLRKQVKRQSKDNAETLVDFSDRIGRSMVDVMVEDDNENNADQLEEQKLGEAEVENEHIAEYTFLSLVLREDAPAIATYVSDRLTENFEFDSSARKHQYYWLDVPWDTISNCLVYLESRGLAKAYQTFVAPKWKLTARGRSHATFLKAKQDFS